LLRLHCSPYIKQVPSKTQKNTWFTPASHRGGEENQRPLWGYDYFAWWNTCTSISRKDENIHRRVTGVERKKITSSISFPGFLNDNGGRGERDWERGYTKPSSFSFVLFSRAVCNSWRDLSQKCDILQSTISSQLKRNTRINERTWRIGRKENLPFISFYMKCQEKYITSFCGHDSEGQGLTNENAPSFVYNKTPSWK